MDTCIVVTLISDDRPGVVEDVAKVIEQHQGSWQESRMAHLDGKFAGILRVAVAQAAVAALQTSLAELSAKGIQISASQGRSAQAAAEKSIKVSAIGPDRPGIVKELSQAFAQRKLNVSQLDTDCSSMPWSGEPQFEAQFELQLAQASNIDDLEDSLDAIADDLALDIKLED